MTDCGINSDGQAAEPEMCGRREKMAIIGVDLVKSLLARAPEMKSVGRAKEDTAIKLTDPL